MANYSTEQLGEIDKLLKYVKQMESIIRTSPSADQVSRVKKQLSQYVDRLSQLVPGIDRMRVNVDQIREQVGLVDGPPSSGASSAPAANGQDRLAKFPVRPASTHSTDPDVNLLATVLGAIQTEFWPVISDLHCKLDFSNSAERDAIRTLLESAGRNLKVLLETVEEYAGAEKQDFREQLLKMKNKQSRVFLFETNTTLKKLRDFLRKLGGGADGRSNIVMNPDDILKFNRKFEEAQMLEGLPVSEGIVEFTKFVEQAVGRLNLPEMKING